MGTARKTALDPELAKEATSLFVRAPAAMRQRLVLYLYREEECWAWGGTRDKNGYGRFWYDYKVYKPYRLSYEWVHGRFPTSLYPDHLCRNAWCVNPAHIEPATPRENVLRGKDSPPKTNYNKTECDHGHPFTSENTYTYNGHRSCKECARRLVREHRARTRRPPKLGSSRADSKLTDEQVIDIKRRLALGESKPSIAKLVRVSPKVIYDIDRGVTWKHI